MFGLRPVDVRALTWSQFVHFTSWADQKVAQDHMNQNGGE